MQKKRKFAFRKKSKKMKKEKKSVRRKRCERSRNEREKRTTFLERKTQGAADVDYRWKKKRKKKQTS